MEQKTPARGHSLGLPRFSTVRLQGRETLANARRSVDLAKELAQKVASIAPEHFDKVMPRGYSISGNCLVMARFEISETRGNALYARHSAWGEREATVFLRDLKEEWLDELSSFMRWQLRADPMANAVFQHALVHLKIEAERRLLIV